LLCRPPPPGRQSSTPGLADDWQDVPTHAELLQQAFERLHSPLCPQGADAACRAMRNRTLGVRALESVSTSDAAASPAVPSSPGEAADHEATAPSTPADAAAAHQPGAACSRALAHATCHATVLLPLPFTRRRGLLWQTMRCASVCALALAWCTLCPAAGNTLLAVHRLSRAQRHPAAAPAGAHWLMRHCTEFKTTG
jgi:hypothetical protein